MRLSEKIREGCALNSQAYGYFKNGDGSTCALGSAAEAAGFRFKGPRCFIDIEMDEFFRARFPLLGQKAEVPINCPECTGFTAYYYSTIVAHLNDVHKWSREKIADWVEQEEDKLNIPRSVDVSQPVIEKTEEKELVAV